MGTKRESRPLGHRNSSDGGVSIEPTVHEETLTNEPAQETANSESIDQVHPQSPSKIHTADEHGNQHPISNVSEQSIPKPHVTETSSMSKGHSRVSRTITKPRTLVDKLLHRNTSSSSHEDSSNQQEEITRLKHAIAKKHTECMDQGKEIVRQGKLLEKSASQEKALMYELSEMKRQLERSNADLDTMETDLDSRDCLIKKYKTKVKELQNEKDSAIVEIQEIVRKQQEESFKNIESALWIPREDGQVKIDLDELKRSMKSLAKSIAVTEAPVLLSFRDEHRASIFAALENVTGSNDNCFDGVSKKQLPILILNALLAHAVYTSIVKSAFFFNLDQKGSNPLADLYEITLKANEKDAHNWRAQTMRLLCPQITGGSGEEEVKLRSITEYKIGEAARGHAYIFMGSAACAFMKDNGSPDTLEKVTEVFVRAARLSYELWTRKTAIRVTTVKDISDCPYFDSDNPCMTAHASVNYEEHNGLLKGRRVRMFVHPLLEAYGTDDGDQYEKTRVLMPAEVWLPSGKHAEPDPEAKDVDLIEMGDNMNDK